MSINHKIGNKNRRKNWDWDAIDDAGDKIMKELERERQRLFFFFLGLNNEVLIQWII